MTKPSVPSAALPVLKNSWQPTQAFRANPGIPCPAPMTQRAAVPGPGKKAGVPVLAPVAAGPFKTTVQNSSAFKKRIKRRISGRPHVFFAVCPPGLSGICAKEVARVSQKAEEIFSDKYNISNINVLPGGIEFTTRLKTACLANILMGSATRILMRLATFKADGFRRLEEQIKDIDWELYLPQPNPSRYQGHHTQVTPVSFHSHCRSDQTHPS